MTSTSRCMSAQYERRFSVFELLCGASSDWCVIPHSNEVFFSSFPPDDSWYCVTYSIGDSELRLTCWSSCSLTHGHSFIVLALTRRTLIYMPVNNLICWPISPFSENMWHQSSLSLFFFLASVSLFNPFSCKLREEEKRKMGVSARKHTAAEGH